MLSGGKEHKPRGHGREKTFSSAQPKLQLLIDIQDKIAQGKGSGYVRWAKTFNLKQMAAAVCFIRDQGVNTFEELTAKTETTVTKFDDLSASVKNSEQRLAEIAALKKHIINYSHTRDVYADYRKSGYSRKFLEEHREEITLHKAAKKAFDEYTRKNAESSKTAQHGGAKIPTIKELNQEYAQVLSDKKQTYQEYWQAKKEMQDLLIAKKTVETILNLDGTNEKKEEQSR